MDEHKPQKVKITPRQDGETISHVHLFIGGTEIRDIRSLTINVEPNQMPTMTLDLNLYDLSIDSEFLLYQKNCGAINFVEAKENSAG